MVSGNQDSFDPMIRQAMQRKWKDFSSRWVNGSQMLPGGRAGTPLLWGEGSHKRMTSRTDTTSKASRSEESFMFANKNHAVRKHNRTQWRALPHLAWNGEQFKRSPPNPPPLATVEVDMMPRTHAKFDCVSTGPVSRCSHKIIAFADTGAQTCSSGPEIQELLGYSDEYLVPTTQRIRGITDNQLHIKGILLLHIRVGSRKTRQAVYVVDNTSGFYLSQAALKDLGLLPLNFPSSVSKINSSMKAIKSAPCGCPARTSVPPRPDTIPFPPTETNRHQLEQWIKKKHFESSAFNTYPHQPLQTMTGKPLDITFIPGVTPTAVHTPIPVPHHWKKRVKQDLDRDVALGIIEPVPIGTPTTWCSRMVVAPKKDGSPRRTVDLQKLNAATRRETHHTPYPFNQASVIPANTRKTVLDAWNGYHSLPLSPAERDTTTFITEWGRYRYCRAPLGFHGSGDGYTRRFDDITVDMVRKTRCIDDRLLWDGSMESAFWHTVDYISHCADNRIVFNPDKFYFAKMQVNLLGSLPPPRVLNPQRG